MPDHTESPCAISRAVILGGLPLQRFELWSRGKSPEVVEAVKALSKVAEQDAEMAWRIIDVLGDLLSDVRTASCAA